MASLDFEFEKNQFRDFFESNMRILEDAKNSFVTLINALITHNGNISISKLEGRVKSALGNSQENIEKI